MPDRITGLSSMATRPALAALAAAYGRDRGREVAITSLGGVEAARRVRAGEAIDLVVLAAGAMARLAAEGHVAAGSLVPFARSGIAVAVRAGTPLPALGDAAALRRALLDGGRIGTSTGPSGDHLRRLMEGWGLTETLADRLVQAPPGVPVGALLARGEVDLGFQQASEFLDLPGIAVVGPLPAEVQAVTVFTAGLCRAAAHPEPARAFIAVLTSGETAARLGRYGLEAPEPS